MRRRQHQSGQVMVIVAFMMLIMIGGILIGFDLGRLVLARIMFQNGADAAALAAVAVKVDKHHFDTVWRWAMQQEAFLVKLEQARARITLARAIIQSEKDKLLSPPGINPPGPGGPPTPPGPGPNPPVGGPPLQPVYSDLRQKYFGHVNTAYRRAAKLHTMDKELAALYRDWPETIKAASRQAAEIAWRMNIGTFATEAADGGKPNGDLLASATDLFENNDGLPTIGGVVYQNERAGDKGLYGKTAVELNCAVVPFSLSYRGLTKVLKHYPIRVNAGAQPVASMKGSPKQYEHRYIFARETPLGVSLVGIPNVQWHRPVLFSIVGSEAGPLH